MGIEPTSEAWEASILPLNYARDSGSKRKRFYHLTRRAQTSRSLLRASEKRDFRQDR
jgi:hypothetical protein